MSVAPHVLQSLHAPLLLATTDTDINVTFSSSHDPNDILLYDFDRQVFLEVMLVYAAPMAAALVVRYTSQPATTALAECAMTRPERITQAMGLHGSCIIYSVSLVLASRPALSPCTKVASD